MIVGVEVLSASWRPRKTDGVVRSEPKGLRTRGSDGQEPEKVDVPAQAESEGIALPPPTLGRADLHSVLNQTLISSRNSGLPAICASIHLVMLTRN